jgi:hypothetical protein
MVVNIASSSAVTSVPFYSTYAGSGLSSVVHQDVETREEPPKPA